MLGSIAPIAQQEDILIVRPFAQNAGLYSRFFKYIIINDHPWVDIGDLAFVLDGIGIKTWAWRKQVSNGISMDWDKYSYRIYRLSIQQR